MTKKHPREGRVSETLGLEHLLLWLVLSFEGSFVELFEASSTGLGARRVAQWRAVGLVGGESGMYPQCQNE